MNNELQMTNYQTITLGISNFFIISPLSLLLVFSMFFIAVYISCSKSPTNTEEPKRPQIEVAGSITENTIWEIGKDYVVRGMVTVEENAVLTIKKDVNVYFTLDSLGNKGKLYVKGMIYADGEDSRTMVTFGPKNEQANGEESWGIDLYSVKSVTEFKYCSFHNCFCGIKIVNTDIFVTNCCFEGCVQGINISKCDSVCVLNSEFLKNTNAIKIEYSKGLSDSCIILIYNSFINCSNVAVEITNNSNALITDNIFNNCYYGLRCYYNSGVELFYNDFYNCNESVKFMSTSDGEIKRNDFKGGSIAIYLSGHSNPLIQNNNFSDFTEYVLIVNNYDPEMVINAEYNWWSIDRKSEIEIMIYDNTDMDTEQKLGRVDFEPFESAPIIDCGIR